MGIKETLTLPRDKEYLYDCGVEAAAEMIERLAASSKDEATKEAYLNGARWVRALKESYNYTDNPYSFLIAKDGLGIVDPDIIPLPKAPDGYSWVALEEEGYWFICYEDNRFNLIGDLKAAMMGRGMFGTPKDALGLPLDHLINYGICNVLKLNNKQVNWPPIKIEETYWKHYLKATLDEPKGKNDL